MVPSVMPFQSPITRKKLVRFIINGYNADVVNSDFAKAFSALYLMFSVVFWPV